eukprot:PLAT4729.1.p1 GENE.PLAT4729.1~~PLAT4729.1.p1  ORF type:complete len:552 (-),score=232.32 PLAT4729.1:90-1745(-)
MTSGREALVQGPRSDEDIELDSITFDDVMVDDAPSDDASQLFPRTSRQRLVPRRHKTPKQFLAVLFVAVLTVGVALVLTLRAKLAPGGKHGKLHGSSSSPLLQKAPSVNTHDRTGELLVSDIHFATWGSDALTVSWKTAGSSPGAAVIWRADGSDPGTDAAAAGVLRGQAESSSYLPEMGVHHHGRVTGLTADSQLVVRAVQVHNGNTSVSRAIPFHYRPASSDGERIAIVADFGYHHSGASVTSLMSPPLAYQSIIHLGDFAYANAEPSASKYEQTWELWQQRAKPLLEKYAYMTQAGNHDVHCYGCRPQLKAFDAYLSRFRMPYDAPENGPQTTNSLWYSFNHGRVHFVMINTETDYPEPHVGPEQHHTPRFGDQWAWLRADLAAANTAEARRLRPWVIVCGHRPMYSSLIKDRPRGFHAMSKLRAVLEQLMYDNDVDLYLSGHMHAYERVWPVFNDVLNMTGATRQQFNNPRPPTYIVMGSTGCVKKHSYSLGHTKYPAYLDNHHYGWGHVHVVDRDHLTWSFIRADQNTVLDSVDLYRDHSRYGGQL